MHHVISLYSPTPKSTPTPSLSLSKYTHLLSLKPPIQLPSPEQHGRRFSSVMAQKREKEETELKVPEALPLCTPSIAAAPTISSSDDHRSSPDRSDLNTGNAVDSRSSSTSSPEKPDLDQKPCVPTAESSEDEFGRIKKREVNRCSGCRRKVGLIGFRCRCGEIFCSDHRYSDRHDCCYDYKAAGREAIARENPVVRAAKILKV